MGRLGHPILATPLKPEAGTVAAPDVPGAGLSWDEPAVKKYAVQL
jgi:mandelate racemase